MNKYEFYFDEPRLRMTTAGRFLIRAISSTVYALIAAAAIIFSLSDIPWLKSLGLFFALFILERLLHLGQPEKSLAHLPKEGRLNAAKYFLPASYRLIESAYEKSLLSGRCFALHLLRLLTARREIQEALKRMDIPIKDFSGKIEENLEKTAESRLGSKALYEELVFLAKSAFGRAVVGRSPAVEPKDLFAAVSELKEPAVVKLFSLFNIESSDLENALIVSSRPQRFFGGLKKFAHFIHRPYKIRHRIMNRAWTAKPTPLLDKFSTDLTDLARRGEIGFLVGHEQEYEQLLDVLARSGRPNALLAGEAGAGKSTLVHHLAFQVIKDRVPPPLFDKRLVELSLGALHAGAGEGELEDRVKKILDEIIRAGNIILYIPDIHNLVKGGLKVTAADILLPIIKGSAFSVVGSTYPKEFKQYIEPNSEFAEAFEVVRVNELNEPQAVKLLAYDSLILESQYKVIVSFKAIKEAVALAHKYFRGKPLPGSAEDLLKEALAGAAERKKDVLTPEDIIAVAERRINVPIHEVKGGEAQKLLGLEKLIHESLIDQDEAVHAVSQAMREYRSGLSRKGGPIANFLFVGPTGVGKTELAKTLTKIQFGNQNLMLRFDMSEYQDKQSFSRFIGSPDGQVRGALTDAVLEKPYSLILLDEFEKAHPDILNLFLQVFDDGRLTDNLGRTVDFQNTIIIATSNAHSEFIKTEIEKGAPVKEISEQLKRKLTDYFRAELLNRFSAIIVFKPLSQSELVSVARIQLEELSGLLRENQGIELTFEELAIQELSRLGFDPVFGARPLRRVISEKIRAVLAEKILKGEVKRGSSVKAVLNGEEIEFNI